MSPMQLPKLGERRPHLKLVQVSRLFVVCAGFLHEDVFVTQPSYFSSLVRSDTLAALPAHSLIELGTEE